MDDFLSNKKLKLDEGDLLDFQEMNFHLFCQNNALEAQNRTLQIQNTKLELLVEKLKQDRSLLASKLVEHINKN